MAAVLHAKFPQVEVITTTFEEWVPPPDGVDLIGCALAWHWLDPATRNQRTHDALAPGGTLAVFGHKYSYADKSQADRIGAVLTAIDPTVQDRADPLVVDDVTASGVWSAVQEKVWHSYPVFSRQKYCSSCRRSPPFPTGTARRIRRQRLAASAPCSTTSAVWVTLDLSPPGAGCRV